MAAGTQAQEPRFLCEFVDLETLRAIFAFERFAFELDAFAGLKPLVSPLSAKIL